MQRKVSHANLLHFCRFWVRMKKQYTYNKQLSMTGHWPESISSKWAGITRYLVCGHCGHMIGQAVWTSGVVLAGLALVLHRISKHQVINL